MGKPKSVTARARQVILLVLWSLLITALIVEIYFRFVAPEVSNFGFGYSPDNPYQFDENVGVIYQSHWTGRHMTAEFDVELEMNALGFRSSEPYRSTGEIIAVLGDSFVSGNHVEEAAIFSERLETMLPEIDQVQNFGVDGIGIVNYLQMYRHYARQFQPSTVIITITPINDFSDSSPTLREPPELAPTYIRDAAGQIVDIEPFNEPQQTWRDNVHDWLVRNSALYSFGNRLRLRSQNTDDSGLPISFFIYEEPWQDDFAAAWDYSAWALSELVTEIEADGAMPIVVLLPARPLAKDDTWETLTDLYDTHFDNQFVRDRVRNALADLTAEIGVSFLDLSDTMRGALANGDEPYLVVDGHLNEYGHQLVAEAIHAHLMEQ